MFARLATIPSVDRRPVVGPQAAAQGVSQQLRGQVAGHQLFLVLEDELQLGRAVERAAVGQRARGVDGELAVAGPEGADGKDACGPSGKSVAFDGNGSIVTVSAIDEASDDLGGLDCPVACICDIRHCILQSLISGLAIFRSQSSDRRWQS